MFTRDLKRSQQAIDRLDGGYPWVNTIQVAYDELPFGGTKHSGFGKEHGVEVLDFYTEQKSVVVAGGQTARELPRRPADGILPLRLNRPEARNRPRPSLGQALQRSLAR